MRRRARALVTLGLTSALLATACGGGGGGGGGGGDNEKALPECPVHALDDVSSPVDLVVWHTQQAKSLDTLNELVSQYNSSQSKVRVRLEAQGTSYTELMRKFQAAVPSRQLPNIAMFDDTAVQTMADSGVVLPAQSCIDADNYDMSDFLKVAKDYYTIKGVLWPASADIGNILFFFNKNHFRQAGLDPDNPPKTLAEMRTAAEKIKAAGIVSMPIVQEMASWKTEFWLTGNHSAMVDNDNGRGTDQTTAATLSDNPQALELFSWFKDMHDAGLLNAVPATEGQINQYLAMANQQSSMMVESSSAATSVEAFLGGTLNTGDLGLSEAEAQAKSGLDIGASVFPGMDAAAGNRTQMGGAAFYMTNTGSPAQQAAAWDFMKFMNTSSSMVKMLTGGSYLPYRVSAADTPEAQAFFSGSLSGRWLKIANDQVREIDPAFPGPLIGPYDEFRKAIQDAEDSMMFSGASPQAALDQAQSTATQAIQRYNSEGF